MTGAGRKGPRLESLRPAAWRAAVVFCVFALGRCASVPPPSPRDHFPLDPREGLPGPFDDAIGQGWRELLAGNTAGAMRAFERGRSGSSGIAAGIGEIEALVASGRSEEALARCADALEDAAATLPRLVACGEAEARAGSPEAGYELYARAAAEARPPRPGLSDRARKLLAGATDDVLARAAHEASQGRYDEARALTSRALAWNPKSAPSLAMAAQIECDAGEKERALQYDREALAVGGLSEEDREKAGLLALELGDDALAVSVFDALASEDPRFGDEAAEARLAFRIANWPEAERHAARARRLTRSGAAGLVWWMFPEVREARLTSGVVAIDVLERRDSRPMIRAVGLGLIEVDPDTHRARPDAALTRAAAAELLLRLAGLLSGSAGGGLPCLKGSPGPWRGASDAIRLAVRCGLLSESGGSPVSGPELTRGLDKLRSLLPAGEGHES